MRVHLAHPGAHREIVTWPLQTPLAEWTIDGLHGVLGLHRHEVRLVERAHASYVVKELPGLAAWREWTMLRILAEERVPTVEAVAVITDRADGNGLIVTRHLDYSLPYRTLLSGRGLHVPFLGDRLIDALVGLLARLHLVGVFWGDCSLSNTLFRRDAGALAAYAIDMETAEHHDELSTGQRRHDLIITTENVAGDLLDLQAGGRLAEDIDPESVALAIEHRYQSLWAELTAAEAFSPEETFRIDQRLRRLHELGYDVTELEVVGDEHGDATRMQMIPTVVEPGYHRQRLEHLTGLLAEENQARRLLDDLNQYGATLAAGGQRLAHGQVAARWLDERYAPTVRGWESAAARATLEPAELFHAILEHRWYLSEQAQRDVGMEAARESFFRDVVDPLGEVTEPKE